MGALLEAFQTRLAPELATRVSALPVVPEPSRRPSLNVNAITGGQSGEATQSACVADRCVATFDRRFIPEEPFDEVRAEIARLVASVEGDDPERRFTIEERLVVHPTSAPPGSPLVAALSRAGAGAGCARTGGPGVTAAHTAEVALAGHEHRDHHRRDPHQRV